MPYIYHNTFNKKLTRKKGITAQAIEIFQLRVYSGSVKDPTLFFLVIGLFFYYLSKEFFYYHHTSALRYLGLLVVTLLYCYSEPRFLLLNEGTSILFVLMLMLPFVKDDTLFRENPVFYTYLRAKSPEVP